MRLAVSWMLGLVLAAPAIPSAGSREEPWDSLAAGFEVLVSHVEAQRGLRFVRRPVLEESGVGDQQPASRVPSVPGGPRCAHHLEGARIACLPTADADDVARSLAELIDAQHHPDLAARAPTLSGDPGQAIRALLSASAQATAGGGLPAAFETPPAGILDSPSLEVAPAQDAGAFLVLAATTFLRLQPDREAALRDPPLSTRQLLNPRDYRTGVWPLLLRGNGPALAGCEVARNESVGPGALLLSAARRAREIPSAPLSAWRGDRLVELACSDHRLPWVYVAEFEHPAAAHAFVENIEAFLPVALPRPFERIATGLRAVAWRDLAADEILAWTEGLEAVELRSLGQLDPSTAGTRMGQEEGGARTTR